MVDINVSLLLHFNVVMTSFFNFFNANYNNNNYAYMRLVSYLRKTTVGTLK